MTPCKFQTAVAGEADILVYSEDRKTVWALVSEPENKETIINHLGMPRQGGKAFAMARVDDSGQLLLGDKLPDQGW